MLNVYSLFIASFQGGLRLFLIYIAGYLVLSNQASFVSELALFFSLSIFFIVSQGTHLIKLNGIQEYSELLVYRFYVLLLTSILYFPLVLFLWWLGLISEPFWFYFSSVLFSINQLQRSLMLSQRNFKMVVFWDIVFSVQIVFFIFIFFNEFNGFYFFVFLFFIIYVFCFLFNGVCFFRKDLKWVVREIKEAFYNGASNFCSGGILLLLPFMMEKINPDFVIITAKYVSWLGLGMLLPRMLLIRVLPDFSEVVGKGAGVKKFIEDLNSKNYKFLCCGIFISVVMIFLILYFLKVMLIF
ncbi:MULTISPECIES: hypothetical protein [Marinomonas]|uniref:Polysaccharide biosynthesis protein n=1 Tax=Marinomonas rhodophyticola TaxID=2992803 RepID=A0ABT3KKE1_9GAMM|nr:hypothetical protein [Marinomonas sp. KJ51-3]MCW4631005.1 hypothetical protein [Marinomonas sp. KJ51-3]